MVVILVGMFVALAASLAARRVLAVRERDVDYEREYRPPLILGQMPNVPRA